MARASWIAMLGYFAFVFVTLLGVEDADFFVPSRQTQLPLVNVAIPTASFFWFAPALGAALYVYLHIVLLKLWDAVADLEKPRVDGHPVGDLINPWLANDWALSQRGGEFTPARPLRVLGNVATFALVWAAGLFVLVFAWWRSMPAHKEGLTLWLGLCIIVAGVAGLDSWRAARAWLIPPRREPFHRPLWRRPGVAIAVATLAAVSWAKTEGGLDRYGGATVDLANQLFRPSEDWEQPNGYLRQCYPAEFANDPQAEGPPVPDCYDAYGEALPRDMVQERRIVAIWPGLDDLTLKLPVIGIWNPLARTNIEGVEMVVRPDGWRDFEAAQRSYRETWCKREGLEMAVCGQPANSDDPTPEHVGKKRLDWCDLHEIPRDACKARFNDFNRRFAEDWRAERAAVIADLPRLDLTGQDLRRVAAADVMLEGANLRGARMEEADFRRARTSGGRGWRGRTSSGRRWRGLALGCTDGGGVPQRGADGEGGPQLGEDGRGVPKRGADGGGEALAGADGEGGPQLGEDGGGGPPRGEFPERNLGQRIKPGVAGPVCGFSHSSRLVAIPARILHRERPDPLARSPERIGQAAA